VNPSLSFGVSLFGNGGMNTSYTTPIPLLGNTRAGVDLEQLFVAPTEGLAIPTGSGSEFCPHLCTARNRAISGT